MSIPVGIEENSGGGCEKVLEKCVCDSQLQIIFLIIFL